MIRLKSFLNDLVMFRIFNKIIILSVFIPLCAFSQKKNIVFDVDSIPVFIENKNGASRALREPLPARGARQVRLGECLTRP